MIHLSVIIPIYNEASNINKLWERLTIVLNSMKIQYECIFVNDGSKDESLTIIKQLAVKSTDIRYLDFSRNFGHQIAVTAGLDHAHGDHVVIIDADMQDPPELIPELYAKALQGFDVVYAKRKRRKGESLFKRLTAKSFYRLLSALTNFDIPLDTGDYRIISKRVLEALNKMPEKDKFLRGQISWIGFNQSYIEYVREERQSGESGYSVKKMLHLALNGITGFSDIPLKFVSYLGFLVFFIALFLMIYSLYSWLVKSSTVPGWTSIMLSVLFIGGIQMIAIGIIGEYLARMNNNVRNRPLYIIREKN